MEKRYGIPIGIHQRTYEMNLIQWISREMAQDQEKRCRLEPRLRKLSMITLITEEEWILWVERGTGGNTRCVILFWGCQKRFHGRPECGLEVSQ